MEDIKKIKKAFSNAKYRYNQRIIEEVGLQLLQGKSVDINKKYLVKDLVIKNIIEKGITIKESKSFIKLKGVEALKYRTKQLNKLTNKNLQKSNYLQNFQNILEISDFSEEEKKEIIEKLKTLSPSQLSYAIKQGYVQISVLYTSKLDTKSYVKHLTQRIKVIKEKFNKLKKEVKDKNVRELAKNIIKLVK